MLDKYSRSFLAKVSEILGEKTTTGVNDRPPQAFSLLRSTLGKHILFMSLLSGYCAILGFGRHLGLAQ